MHKWGHTLDTHQKNPQEKNHDFFVYFSLHTQKGLDPLEEWFLMGTMVINYPHKKILLLTAQDANSIMNSSSFILLFNSLSDDGQN